MPEAGVRCACVRSKRRSVQNTADLPRHTAIAEALEIF